MAKCSPEIQLKTFMKDSGIVGSEPMFVHSDSKIAIYIVSNYVFMAKHIEVD